MSALSDLLNQRRGDRSVREVGRAATNYGIGESTVIPYFSGKHGERPPEKVLIALAAVLDIRIEELREAAGKPVGEREPYRPPEEANLLDQRQRRAVDELIRSIVASRGATDDTTDSDSPATTSRTSGAEDQEAEPDDRRQSDYDLVHRTRDPRVPPEIPDEPDAVADPDGPEFGA